MRLFIVSTTHTDYDEHDAFIVVADSEIQAKALVEMDEHFREDKLSRLRESGQEPWGDGMIHGWYKPEDKPSEIIKVEEVPLNQATIVLAVFNPG